MPDKIQPNDGSLSQTAQSLFDLIFPKALRQQANLSDAEANAIYTMWKNSPVGATTFAVPEDTSDKIVSALKVKGYVCGYEGGMELTEKGKKVIVEMATHEPNAFERHAKEVSYNGIKSQSSTRPRQAFIKKQAAKDGKVFNLRKASIRKLQDDLNGK